MPHRELPPGARVFTRKISPELTGQELSDFFQQRGIELPVENISITHRAGLPPQVLVSISNDTVAALVNWAINGEKVNGEPIAFLGWART